MAGGIDTYTYALNNPVSLTDPLGLDVTLCLYPGAAGFGHVGVGVNSTFTVGFYAAEDSVGMALGQPVLGIVKLDEREATECKTYSTTDEQDAAAQRFIDATRANPPLYELTGRNCVAFARSVLGIAGIQMPDVTILPEVFFEMFP